MTPKEIAEDLLNKFDLPTGLMSTERKQCALITIDFMLEETSNYLIIDRWMPPSERVFMSYEERIELWEKVKIELQKL